MFRYGNTTENKVLKEEIIKYYPNILGYVIDIWWAVTVDKFLYFSKKRFSASIVTWLGFDAFEGKNY